jgi:hypothetical protein
MIPPSSTSGIHYIYNEARKALGIPDRKRWAMVGSDEGAVDESGLQGDLMYVMGTGHEIAVMVRCINGIAWNYGGDIMAYLHGYMSEGQQSFLKSGGDNRKVKAFLLRVCRDAVHRTFVREWMDTLSPAEKQLMKFSFDAYWTWLIDRKTNGGDPTFSSAVQFWVLGAIPHLSLADKGQNNSDFFAHSAGRKVVNRYLFVRNHRNYATLQVRDTAILHHRCKKEVLDLRIDFFCCAGTGPCSAEGYDFKHEVAANKGNFFAHPSSI